MAAPRRQRPPTRPPQPLPPPRPAALPLGLLLLLGATPTTPLSPPHSRYCILGAGPGGLQLAYPSPIPAWLNPTIPEAPRAARNVFF